MRIPSFPLPALALLLLLLAAPAFASTADDPARALAVDQGKAEAATLLQKGEADKAYELLMRLVRIAPEDDEVHLGLARAATQAKRWNQAVMAYETLLEKHTRAGGLYGELANVYMLLGDREAAERSLAMMRSLDGKSTEADTARALDILESRYSGFQVRGKVRTGLQYDSNANLGPGSNALDLGIWRVQLDGAKAKGSFGAYLGAELDLGWRPYRDTPWWLVGDVHAFWRGHENSAMGDSHSQVSHWGRAALGGRHLSSSTLTEVRLKGEIFDYEFYQQVSSWGPEGTFLWAATPRLHLIARANIEKREYSRDHLRDGTAGSAGLYGRIFLGEKNHELILGCRYIAADAKKKAYRNDGWEGSVRMVFKLPHGFELSPSLSYAEQDYKGPATVLEDKNRKDELFRAGLGATYRINDSWSLEAVYQYTDNNSNSALYRYDQHHITTGIVWSF